MAETQTESDMGGGDGGGVAVAAGREYPDFIRQLGDQMAGLSSGDAKGLRKYLEETGAVSYQPGVDLDRDPAAVPDMPTTITVVEEQTHFDVVLTGFDAAKKMGVIKTFRAVIGLGLAESKAAVEGVTAKPFVLKEGLPKAEAEKMKKQFEDEGAKIELK